MIIIIMSAIPPQVLEFILYILPSATYRKEFNEMTPAKKLLS